MGNFEKHYHNNNLRDANKLLGIATAVLTFLSACQMPRTPEIVDSSAETRQNLAVKAITRTGLVHPNEDKTFAVDGFGDQEWCWVDGRLQRANENICDDQLLD